MAERLFILSECSCYDFQQRSYAALQSSILTLSPLSTADTCFTCAVVVTVMENTLDASEPGVKSTEVNVTSESV